MIFPPSARTARAPRTPGSADSTSLSRRSTAPSFPTAARFSWPRTTSTRPRCSNTQQLAARRDPHPRFEHHPDKGGTRPPSPRSATAHPSVGIVIGVLSRARFNLERLGHMVIGVYASNAAARYQIRARASSG